MSELRKLKITEMNRLSVEEFKEAEKLPLVVVLDEVRSLHNIGAVFRTSDAFFAGQNPGGYLNEEPKPCETTKPPRYRPARDLVSPAVSRSREPIPVLRIKKL